MPKNKLFYSHTDIDGIRKIANDENSVVIVEGKVLVAFADGTAKIQLSGSSTTVTAQTTKNTTVLPGDFVFLIRSTLTSRWFVLTSAMIQNMTGVIGSTGGSVVDAPTSGPITAPNSLNVIATDKSLIAQWETSGVQTNVVYQVGIADAADGTGEVQKIVAGSQYVYAAPVGTTKYFRVRSVDENWNFSGWIGYISGTVISPDIAQIETFLRRVQSSSNNNSSGSGGGGGSPVSVITKSIQTRTVLYDNTLGSDTANWDVSSIDQTYNHLELFIYARASDAANSSAIRLAFNNDTTSANYDRQYIIGSGGSAIASADNLNYIGGMPANNATANRFSVIRTFIPNYTNANQKIIENYGGLDNISISDTTVIHSIILWKNTSAINRITIDDQSGGNLKTGSRFVIVGIKVENVVVDVVGGGSDLIEVDSMKRRLKESGEFLLNTFAELRIKINGILGKIIHANTADRVYTLPDNSGTIALTTDQPDLVQIEMYARRSQPASSATTGGSGITQLTGEVTAGPGSGSQAATITSPITGKGFTGGTIDNSPIGNTTPSTGKFATTLLLYIGGFFGSFVHANTSGRTYTFKDADGTVAFTTDQPDILQIEVFN